MTLFDFDQCGYGWRSFDIGKFLHIALGTGISRYIREALLEGYQAMAPLSQKELNCLQAFTETAHIWTWAISINTAKVSNYSRLDPCYFTMRLQQLKRLKSRDWQLF